MIVGKSQYIEILEVSWVNEYRIWIKFNDGAEKEVDLAPLINEKSGTFFSKIQDVHEFKTVRINPVGGLEWHCGVDIAAEYLYVLK